MIYMISNLTRRQGINDFKAFVLIWIDWLVIYERYERLNHIGNFLIYQLGCLKARFQML